MKKTLLFALVAIISFSIEIVSQKLTKPELVANVTNDRGDDFGEFIYHKTEILAYYLKENPNGKIIARLCSKNNLPFALVSSFGFAYNFPQTAIGAIGIPVNKVYFARSSKCSDRIEQYWFVPENTSLDYDEIILAEKVKVNRLTEEYYEEPNSLEAKTEFAKNTKEFIEELKNNPTSEGFIIRNIKTKSRYLQQALRQIRKEKISSNRFQVIRKKRYVTNFPEFMTVLIKQ
jgi:hypothetical protein